MSALAKLRDLIVGDPAGDPTFPAESVAGTSTDSEQGAREAVEQAKAHLADLEARRVATAATIEALTAERSRIGRGLATGESTDADFGQAETALDAARARLAALGELLVEAEDARRTAQERLNEAERPRREAERRERIAALRSAAEATAAHFAELYASAASTLSTLADELDALALADEAGAQGVGRSLTSPEGDLMFRLTRAASPWTVRQRSPYVPVEFRLIALVPPKDR